MKIRFIFDDQTVTGTLPDNTVTQDFVSLLPLTFKLDDYASTEKIAYLPRKLSVEDMPDGTSACAGDISYYAPWGNLVLFYRDFGYASGLIKLGHLDEGLDMLRSNESLNVTIELAESL
ncbi:hypothetical protein CSW98_06535 [Vibrio sp. HA2012]|uniref:cyclophilin-like fold protein n=1 Tax=Vibrio sp. HA2012 TaxID=1971595 RepID=UPI000C2B5E72|nr:cyclophilin-like fold protein [Vibrio sp. HA2012]PJC86649.1 hypothetical protein CSW98_06535 [Vibrio sp. HA2012]